MYKPIIWQNIRPGYWNNVLASRILKRCPTPTSKDIETMSYLQGYRQRILSSLGVPIASFSACPPAFEHHICERWGRVLLNLKDIVWKSGDFWFPSCSMSVSLPNFIHGEFPRKNSFVQICLLYYFCLLCLVIICFQYRICLKYLYRICLWDLPWFAGKVRQRRRPPQRGRPRLPKAGISPAPLLLPRTAKSQKWNKQK